MRRFKMGSVVAAALWLVAAAWAGKVADRPQVQLELDLTDGSRVVGTPAMTLVPVETSYAKMDVPLKAVQTIRMESDHETAVIDMQNGDKVKGVVNLGPVKMRTLFGDISVGLQHVRELHVLLRGAARKGLVFWNRLGSESDIRSSHIGPGGKWKGGRFVQGRFGMGLELNMNEQYGVTFPLDLPSEADGCVEFWAKLVGLPGDLPWGCHPGLVVIDDGKESGGALVLSFNGNDGSANGGLCTSIAGVSAAGTGPYGQWTYARALNSEAVGEWHHYAMVWARDGIPGVDNGTRKIAAYVDGKLNTGVWNGGASGKWTLPAPARLGLLFHQGMPGGSIVFDNLKVWKYAKTDFTDRNAE